MKIGIGQVDYTPRAGLPLMGHFRDDYAAKGVHDPLFCKAMVLEDSAGTKVAMVALDICMLTAPQCDFMRGLIEKECGIDGRRVLVCATHTHGGPATREMYIMPKASDDDIKEFLTVAVGAVVQADKNLGDAKLSVGYAQEERVSFNRRLECKDGKTRMNWEMPDPQTVTGTHGPIDKELITLKVTRNGRAVAALTNFALHPAIIDYENSLYTADYPGYLGEALKKIMGDDFVSIFANNCCGNINHINYADKDAPKRGFVMAQRVGYMLAGAACEAMRNDELIEIDELAATREQVTLERFKISEEQYKWAREFLESPKRCSDDELDGLPAKYTAPVWVKMYEEQEQMGQVEVMVLRIGNLAVVALGGEVFAEIALAIKKKSPAQHTIVIELANDAIGYLPTSEAFGQGGYEVTAGAAMYAKGSAERMMESAIRQLNELFTN